MIDDTIIERLDKDLRKGAEKMNRDEARFLVDTYYNTQEQRIRLQGQLRSVHQGVDDAAEGLLDWLLAQNQTLEKQVAIALKHYALAHPVGQWATSMKGIGPVIAASLLAHIDIEKAQTAGCIWRYAGLDASVEWLSAQKAAAVVKEQTKGKPPTLEDVYILAEQLRRNPDSLERFATTDKDGEPMKLTNTTLTKAISRRPFNAELKTMCWKIGESFVKVSGKEDAYYGKVYLKRKAKETVANAKRAYKKQAKHVLETRNIGKTTATYKCLIDGKLSPAHIHARSKRYAVKLFLAHFHHVYFEWFHGEPPPKPYAIAVLGHKDFIKPPEPETIVT